MKQVYRLYGVPFRIKCLSFQLVLSSFLLLSVTSNAQVNSYAKVTGITNANNRTTLNISGRNQNSHTFAVGEQVLVIQMQGNIIGANTGNDVNFGNLGAAGIGNVGFYDVGTIYSLTGSTAITLTDVLPGKFTFGNDNSVQVVSFQKLSATNFTTNADITAVPWNKTNGYGGVVALQVPGTFTIRHNITADGQGFAGGAKSADFQNTGTPCGPAIYTSNSTSYGAKGEGIYLNANANYATGRARILSGGGGGSLGNAGGGGGSNLSAGGQGGPGWSCTGANVSGGLGGIDLRNTMLVGTRVFMGGGGGGGQGNNNAQTAGTNGGGIIIIQANTITTSCGSSVKISSNGIKATNTNSNVAGGADGAGGAGAGGTILFHVANFNVPSGCPLNIQANGGEGGSVTNADAHGGGGGGGQGAVLFALTAPAAPVNITVNPGAGGKNSSANNSTSAGGGVNAPGGGVIVNIGTVLSVRLIHFAAENINKKAVLNWTASDDANTSFTILHATDGVNFKPIGTVNGTGNSNTATKYSFTDPNAVPGKNYYQLIMSGDVTTRITNSTVVSVNMYDEKSQALAYPNPAHDQFSIRVSNEYVNKMHQVIITDVTGKPMFANTYKPAGGIIKVVPAQQLKPGMYLFKITSEGYEQTGKLFIQ